MYIHILILQSGQSPNIICVCRDDHRSLGVIFWKNRHPTDHSWFSKVSNRLWHRWVRVCLSIDFYRTRLTLKTLEAYTIIFITNESISKTLSVYLKVKILNKYMEIEYNNENKCIKFRIQNIYFIERHKQNIKIVGMHYIKYAFSLIFFS